MEQNIQGILEEKNVRKFKNRRKKGEEEGKRERTKFEKIWRDRITP